MPVLVQAHANVVEIALDWPGVSNALGPDEADALRLAIEEHSVRSDINALIISAQGRSFCAGGNLVAIVEMVGQGRDSVESSIYAAFQGLFRAISASPIPVIMAVDGAAIGLGADLALAGDVTLIGDKGWLAQGWMAAGLIPATGGTAYVAQRGGPQAVWQFLTEGKCNAAKAEALGLAIAVPEARTEALAMAAKLGDMPGAQVRAVKQLSRITDLEEHRKIALQHQVAFLTDPEFLVRAQKLLSRS